MYSWPIVPPETLLLSVSLYLVLISQNVKLSHFTRQYKILSFFQYAQSTYESGRFYYKAEHNKESQSSLDNKPHYSTNRTFLFFKTPVGQPTTGISLLILSSQDTRPVFSFLFFFFCFIYAKLHPPVCPETQTKLLFLLFKSTQSSSLEYQIK